MKIKILIASGTIVITAVAVLLVFKYFANGQLDRKVITEKHTDTV